jgi:hypothetical protein
LTPDIPRPSNQHSQHDDESGGGENAGPGKRPAKNVPIEGHSLVSLLKQTPRTLFESRHAANKQ